MPESQKRDGESHGSDAYLRLRVAVFDSLMAARGIRTVAGQAKACGMHRSTLFRLRAGTGGTNLRRAMAMAQVCETSVENLFDWAKAEVAA